jgi:hypothetical protein
MKIKLDLSMLSEKEIELIKGDFNGLINKENPHYSRAWLYYYDIEKGKDIVINFECSSPMSAYHLMMAQKQMRAKGFDLPYKTEWQRITDPEKIKEIQERESQFEL